MHDVSDNRLDPTPVSALLSRIEFGCLSQYDEVWSGSLLDKIKWSFIHLFVSREIDVKYVNCEKKAHSVIFFPKQLKHLEVQLPVYKELEKIAVSAVFVSTDSQIEKALRKDGLPFILATGTKKYTFNFSRLQYLNKVMILSKRIKSFNEGSKSISFYRAVFYALKFYQTYESTCLVYEEISHIKPKVVIMGYELSLQGRTIIAKAKQEGILTAAIQIGRLRYSMTRFTEVDYYYLYGDKSCQYLSEFAPSSTTPVSAGSFKMENFRNEAIPLKVDQIVAAIRQQYDKLVLLAFSGAGIAVSRDGHISNIRVCKQVIEKFPNHFFLFKLHGKDDISFYKEVSNEKNVKVIDRFNELFQFDILNWISLFDVVISGVSTASMQSLALGKPIISLDVDGELENNLFIQEEVVLYANSMTSMSEHLNALNDPDFYQEKVDQARTFISQYYKQRDVSSSSFIASHLESIVLDKVNKQIDPA